MKVKVEYKLTIVEMDSWKDTFDCVHISQFSFHSKISDKIRSPRITTLLPTVSDCPFLVGRVRTIGGNLFLQNNSSLKLPQFVGTCTLTGGFNLNLLPMEQRFADRSVNLVLSVYTRHKICQKNYATAVFTPVSMYNCVGFIKQPGKVVCDHCW